MRKVLLVVFFLIGFFGYSQAQKEKYQSLFIYNFTKYIKWPDTYSPGTFVIGVIGNSTIIDDLNGMAASKKQTSNGATIEIKKYNSVDEIGACHILFVSENAVDKLGQIETKTSGKPVLLVTDTPGMGTKGAVINFIEKDGKIKFELNESQAEKRSLVVSSSLTSLAIII
jgi:hypothetical protein